MWRKAIARATTTARGERALEGRDAALVGTVAAVAVALAARAFYGAGAAGYDAGFALVWGREIVHGRLPQFESPLAPTPHPLANLVSAALTPLGDKALDAIVLLTLLAFGALAWFCWLLGARLFSPAVGLLFALIVVTRPTLANETLQALVDIPFLAFIAAAACVAVGGGRPWLVLLLLGLAGLLRPEAWPLAAMYVVVIWRGLSHRERLTSIGLALAAPLIWCAFDVIVTGDPLYSLHGTRQLAEELGRPRGAGSALAAEPQFLRDLLTAPVAWTGLAGCLLGLWLLYERTLGAAVVAALGLIGFAVLGAVGLPVLIRYLLIPALVLALFAALATLGWTAVGAGDAGRRVWALAAPVAALTIALSVPSTADDLRVFVKFIDRRHEVQTDLRDLLREPGAKQALAACPRLAAPDQRPVPMLAYWLGRQPRAIDRARPRPTPGTAFIAYASPAAARSMSLSTAPAYVPGVVPPGLEVVAQNASWRMLAAC